MRRGHVARRAPCVELVIRLCMDRGRVPSVKPTTTHSNGSKENSPACAHTDAPFLPAKCERFGRFGSLDRDHLGEHVLRAFRLSLHVAAEHVKIVAVVEPVLWHEIASK